ncbi:MAG: sugar transferase [Candidatus Kapabacteria bacterium]|jgi:lipopolysaccharide/colanic/teichoic acid biosynthesis glycosyltransferase|nr:sugar transferase [Candidatus Kapabacteria bacterium]
MKRLFDLFFSVLLIIVWSPILMISYFVASLDTQSNGIFTQQRVGQYGKLFTIYKLKTIHPKTEKISPAGKFFRKSKIDELPQLFNVLIGDMSFVGFRPDIEGYYDKLEGENRKILELKPGITSEASIKYADEETLLASKENPLEYNDTVIFPEKIKMNLDYYYNRNLIKDIKIIIRTVVSFVK